MKRPETKTQLPRPPKPPAACAIWSSTIPATRHCQRPQRLAMLLGNRSQIGCGHDDQGAVKSLMIRMQRAAKAIIAAPRLKVPSKISVTPPMRQKRHGARQRRRGQLPRRQQLGGRQSRQCQAAGGDQSSHAISGSIDQNQLAALHGTTPSIKQAQQVREFAADIRPPEQRRQSGQSQRENRRAADQVSARRPRLASSRWLR